MRARADAVARRQAHCIWQGESVICVVRELINSCVQVTSGQEVIKAYAVRTSVVDVLMTNRLL
jgi:hypothetical protein